MTERRFTRVLGAIKEQREKVPDSVAAETSDLYPTMKFDRSLIKVGTRINWNGQLKRALVDLWDAPENSPDVAPMLWEDIAYYMGRRIIPETITAMLAFSVDEVGYWPLDGGFYRAKNDNTVWTPAQYPTAWERLT